MTAVATPVTMGLIDGRKLRGRLASFSPFAAVFLLAPESPDNTGGATPVPSGKVAYVAFHRQDERAPAEAPVRYVIIEVHGPSEAVFEVKAPPKEHRGSQGFFAYPVDEQSPYREIFFYSSRVRVEAPDGGPRSQRASSGKPGAPDTHERLAELLVGAGLLSQRDMAKAVEQQRLAPERSLLDTILREGLLAEDKLLSFFASRFGLRVVDLEQYEFNPQALDVLPGAFVQSREVLPIDLNERTITVAVSDPLAVDVADEVQRLTGRHAIEVLAPRGQIRKFLGLSAQKTATVDVAGSVQETLRGLLVQVDEANPKRSSAELQDSDTGVIRLVNQIIQDALKRGASDIHIEPNPGAIPGTIRLRIDGDCVPYLELPRSLATPIVARLKVMSGMDIAEHRRPQDGKIRLLIGDETLDLRAATLPTAGGEDLVLRLLPPSRKHTLDQMGLSERNLHELLRALSQPHGLLLCVGPTGSGKTTTLHAALGTLNTVSRKIWTAEDPIEITQAGLRQVQINHRIGFNFAAAMRAFLRADPDVIMVGEMRDQETANIAVEASLTGHLVLSTLHTNSAPETVVRLLDMGLDPFAFADSLLGVLAQRLVRTLCTRCKEPYTPDEREWRLLTSLYGGEEAFGAAFGIGVPTLRRAAGCERCNGTGLQGRTGIHEFLVVNRELRDAIGHKASIDALRDIAARSGMTTLLQDGVAKIVAGQTDLTRVMAVCSTAT